MFWLLQTWARGGWISKLALIVAHCGSTTRLLPPCHSCSGVLSCCGIMGGDSRKRRKSLELDYNVMEGGCGFNVWMVSLIGYVYDPRELYAYGMTYLGRWPLVNWWMADDVGQWVGCQPMPAEVKSIVFAAAAAAASAGGLCAWILYAAWIPSTSASFAHSAELGWLLGIISGLGDAGWDWDNPSVSWHQIRAGDAGWFSLPFIWLPSPIQDCRWYLILEILHHHGLAQNLPDLMFRRVMMKTLLQVTGLHCEGLGTTHTDCIQLWAIRVIHIISPWT